MKPGLLPVYLPVPATMLDRWRGEMFYHYADDRWAHHILDHDRAKLVAQPNTARTRAMWPLLPPMQRGIYFYLGHHGRGSLLNHRRGRPATVIAVSGDDLVPILRPNRVYLRAWDCSVAVLHTVNVPVDHITTGIDVRKTKVSPTRP